MLYGHCRSKKITIYCKNKRHFLWKNYWITWITKSSYALKCGCIASDAVLFPLIGYRWQFRCRLGRFRRRCIWRQQRCSKGPVARQTKARWIRRRWNEKRSWPGTCSTQYQHNFTSFQSEDGLLCSKFMLTYCGIPCAALLCSALGSTTCSRRHWSRPPVPYVSRMGSVDVMK